MANVLAEIKMSDGGKGLVFFCPGCGYYHHFIVEQGSDKSKPLWTWNGDMEKPTFSPSLGVNMAMSEHRCHSFVRNGQIEYLTDSFHSLAGQTVAMQEIDWSANAKSRSDPRPV